MPSTTFPASSEVKKSHKELCIKLYSDYGEYHHNTANKMIHIVCVPLIIWSLMCLCELLPAPFFGEFTVFWIPINYGLFVWIFHLSIAFGCDFVTACCQSGLYLGMILSSRAVFLALPYWQFFWMASVVQAVSWILQFIGHGVFEGRKPALLDNLFQVNAAPFFVVLELLFFAGYKEELRHECEERILQKIQAYRARKTQ